MKSTLRCFGLECMVNKMIVKNTEKNMSKAEKWKERLMMHSYVEVDGWFYFSALNYNGLYKYKENRLVFLGFIPEENITQRHLYSKIIYVNGKIYMAPMNAKAIAVYDIKMERFTKLSLENEKYLDVPQKFYGIHEYKGKVYLIPARYESIVVIDAISEHMKYLRSWKELTGVISLEGELWVKNGSFILDNWLYMALMVSNKVIRINLDTYESYVLEIKGAEDGFIDAVLDDSENVMWMACTHLGTVVKYSLDTKEITIFNINNMDMTIRYPFINLLQSEKQLYLLAYQNETSIAINKNTGATEAAKFEDLCDDNDLNEWGAKHYFGKRISDNKYIVTNLDDNSFLLIEDGVIKEKFFLLNKERELQIKIKNSFGQTVILEDSKCTQRQFLNCI